MKYVINYGHGAFAVPGEAINVTNSDALRLLVLLCSGKYTDDTIDFADVSQRLGLSEKEVLDSLDCLVSSKIIKEDSTPKQMSGIEMSDIVLSDSNVKTAIDECANICGTVSFSVSDKAKIISLINDERMQCEAVVLLFSYYRDYFEAVGGKVSVSAVYRNACRLRLHTLEDVAKFIEDEKRRNGSESKLRRLFGIGARQLTAKEGEFFRLWTVEWAFSFELIEEAFNRANDAGAQKPMPFMSSILLKWHDNGVTDLEGVKKCDERFKEESGSIKRTSSKPNKRNDGLYHSLNTEEAFNDAIGRSYELLFDDENKKDGE